MTLSRWSVDQVPDQRGRTIVVTGSNSGIGFEAAKHLARKGAHVVMACRDMARAKDAAAAIRDAVDGADLEIRELDVSNLASVRDFAGAFDRDHQALHVLINNAGVMATPQRTTADGYELQFGTNHLGPFALTGLLLGKLLATPGSRVVSVTSYMHHFGRIALSDLQGERFYSAWPAYNQSKLANVLFTHELDRRLRARNADTLSVACHPGYAATSLQTSGPDLAGTTLTGRVLRIFNRAAAQTAEMGSLPTVYAATAEDVEGGQCFGPDGFMEIGGYPVRVKTSKRSRDPDLAANLWTRSEELTGVHYAALA